MFPFDDDRIVAQDFLLQPCLYSRLLETAVTILSYSTSVRGLMKRLLRSGSKSWCKPSGRLLASGTFKVTKWDGFAREGCAICGLCLCALSCANNIRKAAGRSKNCISDGGEVARCRLCYPHVFWKDYGRSCGHSGHTCHHAISSHQTCRSE